MTSLVSLWVLWSTWATATGWALSAVGQGDQANWRAATLAALAVFGVWLARQRGGWARGWWRRTARRMRRPLPAGWLILWLLACLGGLWHAPNNIDALTYRLPRVLHWLTEGGWHWLPTNDARMNYSAVGAEWQMTSLLALTNSTRVLFLLNALPALLFPGLVFSFLRSAGVAGRVAARWMWLLPTAHAYLLQGGGIGNDANGALYFLAAAHFFFRARAERSGRAVGLGLLAAAQLTAWKASNVPLLLPLAILASPVVVRRPGSLVRHGAWLLLAAAVSVAPTLVLNQVHSGHWSGDPANTTGVRLATPWSGLVGNTLQGVVQNLAPPVFPWAAQWNAWSAAHFEPLCRSLWGGAGFERFTLRLGELAQEEWAGCGLLVVLLAVLGAGGRLRLGAAGRWLTWSAWGAALLLFAGLGSEMTARLLAPYYPALLLLWLGRERQSSWLERRWWGALVLLHGFSCVVLLVVGPARPLLPMRAVAERCLGADSRAALVYAVYGQRADALAPWRDALPSGTRAVGFLASSDDAETSLWFPLGSRRVVRLDGEDPRTGTLEWIVVRADVVWRHADAEAAWLARWHGRVVRREHVVIKAARPSEEWALVRLTRVGSDAGP